VSKAYIARVLRKRITIVAQQRCGYCLTSEHIVGAPMEIDHVVPESLGGLTEESNLWLACSRCNGYKADLVAALDPIGGEVVPLFHPRQDVWSEHFEWTIDGDRVAGRTEIGRATVVALHLNRPELVGARRRWVKAGWHPPKIKWARQ